MIAVPNHIDNSLSCDLPVDALRKLCHDCRTPLTVISEFADILSSEVEPGSESAEYLDLIFDRAVDIEDLIADFEFLFKSGVDKPPAITPVPLDELLHELHGTLEETASAQDVILTCAPPQFGATVPCHIGTLIRAFKSVLTSLTRLAGGLDTVQLFALRDDTRSRILIGLVRDAAGPDDKDRTADPELWQSSAIDQLNFRQRCAALLVSRFAGEILVSTGAEHEAFAVGLPFKTASNPVGLSKP